MLKMISATVETICFQDQIPVIVSTSLELETYIQGHHVCREIWTPEVKGKLNVLMEPDNRVVKFAVRVKKDQAVVGYLKQGDDSEKFAKTVFYFLRGDTYCNGYAEVSGKRCSLRDGEGLQIGSNNYTWVKNKNQIWSFSLCEFCIPGEGGIHFAGYCCPRSGIWVSGVFAGGGV